jgi:hypothetical protein
MSIQDLRLCWDGSMSRILVLWLQMKALQSALQGVMIGRQSRGGQQNATKFAKSSRVKTGKENSMFGKGWGFGR